MELSGAVLPNGFAHTAKMFDFRCGSKPRGGKHEKRRFTIRLHLVVRFLDRNWRGLVRSDLYATREIQRNEW
jgi:hypothetical protein